MYNGVAALKKGVEENGLVQESFVDLIDTEDFWVDLEDAYIVKKLD